VLRRAKNGKRIWLVVGLVGAIGLFGAGIALAASQTIEGTASNTYSNPDYTTDQGEVVPFTVTGSQHNVTAHGPGPDGNVLFRSATISGGTTAVNGTQYLTAGDYTFFCSIHPSTMQATLHVTSNGTPQPRPQATLTLVSKKISKVAKKGKLLVGVNMTAPVDGASLVASLGKATLGRANSLSLKAGQQTVAIGLGRAAKSKLAKKSKASVTLTADIPFGSPASGKGKLK
jgi:plastocyanin